MRSINFKRLLLSLILITTFLGIFIDIYVNTIEHNIWKGLSLFKYFTLQSNSLIMIYSFVVLFNIKGYAENAHFKSLLSPFTSYIILTGLTFAILLAPTSTATGLHKVASDLLHYLSPPLMFFFWLIFEERKLKYALIGKWLIYPLLFMLWGLFLALFFGDYLYPFFDLSKYGNFLVVYLLLMAISTTMISLFLVFLNKRLQFRRVS
ncbi:MAG: Pr6Pr family membrane protein [Bacteroidales bacterium]